MAEKNLWNLWNFRPITLESYQFLGVQVWKIIRYASQISIRWNTGNSQNPINAIVSTQHIYDLFEITIQCIRTVSSKIDEFQEF